jgi:hypothetical protein
MRKEKNTRLEKILKKYEGCAVSSKFLAKEIMKENKTAFITGKAVGKLLQKYKFKKIGANTAPKLYLIKF